MSIDVAQPEIARMFELLNRFLAEHPQTRPRTMSWDKWVDHERIEFYCLASEFFREFGREIRRSRVRRRLELADMAEALSVSNHWLSRMECGHRHMDVWQMTLTALILKTDLVTMINRTLEQCLEVRDGSAFGNRVMQRK